MNERSILTHDEIEALPLRTLEIASDEAAEYLSRLETELVKRYRTQPISLLKQALAQLPNFPAREIRATCWDKRSSFVRFMAGNCLFELDIERSKWEFLVRVESLHRDIALEVRAFQFDELTVDGIAKTLRWLLFRIGEQVGALLKDIPVDPVTGDYPDGSMGSDYQEIGQQLRELAEQASTPAPERAI